MYFRNTKVYFQSTKVYSRSTKVYSPSTKVYFQSTSILSNYTSILSKNKSLLWKYKSILWRKNPKTRLLRVLFDSIDLLALFGVYAGIICLGIQLRFRTITSTLMSTPENSKVTSSPVNKNYPPGDSSRDLFNPLVTNNLSKGHKKRQAGWPVSEDC